MPDPLKGIPKSGDVYGEPEAGHRVTRIWAAVVIQANGDEGLASTYTFDAAGQPTGRVTFVTSTPRLLPLLKDTLASIRPPEGGRFEWREYTA